MVKKKRTSLDAVLPPAAKKEEHVAVEPAATDSPQQKDAPSKRPHVKQQALYLKHPVHRQLRFLAFEEDTKMHDLCLEALDLLFANRGLPSIAELLQE